MPERMTAVESELVAKLVTAGMGREDATVAILLATRGYSRPASDLASTLEHYPGLARPGAVVDALRSLSERGWVGSTTNLPGQVMVGPVGSIADRISAFLGDASVEAVVLGQRGRGTKLDVLGAMADASSYETYAERLRSAQNEILMISLATDPDALQTVRILEERAAEGVRVRVLGASPGVVERLRGPSQVAKAKLRIDAWRRIARSHRRIEYRLSDSDEDMLYATSVLIDGETLRLVVHDPFFERSKQGLLLEVAGGEGRQVNLVRDFAGRFGLAWSLARRPGFPGWIERRAQSLGALEIALLVLWLVFRIADEDEGWGKWLGGSWQPFLFEGFLPVGSALLGSWWQRMRGRRAERRALALPRP